MSPKVSILMSVYNGTRFLREAMDSILNQSFGDFEFIIMDDGSNDKTWEILSEYSIRDKRIVLLRNKTNIGLTKSLNRCLSVSCGLYIARQDDDDISLHDRLKIQVDYLDNHPDVILVSGNYDRIDENSRLIKSMKLDCDDKTILWHLTFYNYIGGHSQVMFRRDEILRLGGYSESFTHAQDYDLWLRLSRLGKIAIIRDTILKYRVHDNRITSKNSEEQQICVLNASRNHLTEMLGEQLSLSEMMSLWSFWCLVIPNDSNTQDNGIKFINARLRQIKNAFLKNQYFDKVKLETLRRKIDKLIGERYLSWFTIKILKQHQIINGFIMLYYSIIWLRHRSIKSFLNLLKKSFLSYFKKINIKNN